jgi:hypothetical protein
MEFETLKDLVTDMRAFCKENPEAKIRFKFMPGMFKMGFHVLVGTEFKDWTLPLAAFAKDMNSVLSEEEQKKMEEFSKLKFQMDEVERVLLDSLCKSRDE